MFPKCYSSWYWEAEISCPILNPSFESVHLMIIQVNTVLVPSSPFLSPAYCKGDWFVIILTINYFNFCKLITYFEWNGGWIGEREFGTVFMRFLTSQMCVFSQVPVCVCGSLPVCVYVFLCALLRVCDINLVFVQFSHRRRRTVSA